jgi:hypothetical protein
MKAVYMLPTTYPEASSTERTVAVLNEVMMDTLKTVPEVQALRGIWGLKRGEFCYQIKQCYHICSA